MGHSARETFEMLYLKTEFEIKQKPFAMGVRIEAPKTRRYKPKPIWKKITTKDCQMPTTNLPFILEMAEVFSPFCMCPGGVVVASNSVKIKLLQME